METALKNESPLGHNLPPTDSEILQTGLSEKHNKLLGGAARLIEASERLPGIIEDDETAGKASEYIKQVTGCVKNLESQRVNEKEPYLTLGRIVDGFFKKTTDALSGAKIKAQKPLDLYLKNKAMAEARRRAEEAETLRRDAEAQQAAARALETANMKPQAEILQDQANITSQQADKAERAVAAKPADMAQTRSTSGAVATLRTRWVGDIAELEKIDLEKLRPFIHIEALQKAVNLFVSAGGRELIGVTIYEKSETVVR